MGSCWRVIKVGVIFVGEVITVIVSLDVDCFFCLYNLVFLCLQGFCFVWPDLFEFANGGSLAVCEDGSEDSSAAVGLASTCNYVLD